MYEGTIATVKVGREFGFISVPNQQPNYFFHKNETIDLEWDERLQGRRVQFDLVEMPKGMKATTCGRQTEMDHAGHATSTHATSVVAIRGVVVVQFGFQSPIARN